MMSLAAIALSLKTVPKWLDRAKKLARGIIASIRGSSPISKDNANLLEGVTPNVPKQEDIGVSHFLQLGEAADPVSDQYSDDPQRKPTELDAVESLAVHGETRIVASNETITPMESNNEVSATVQSWPAHPHHPPKRIWVEGRQKVASDLPVSRTRGSVVTSRL